MNFKGAIQFRSSIRPGSGPPGETEILVLNPQRVANILKATGWECLEPGSLNLTVDNAVVDALFKLKPVWIEDGNTVRYPEAFKHIPQLRKAYYYYRARLNSGDNTQEVLVRRAQVPVPGRVELFAPINLTSTFNLAAGDQVVVEVESN